jgi:hypothetical protein
VPSHTVKLSAESVEVGDALGPLCLGNLVEVVQLCSSHRGWQAQDIGTVRLTSRKEKLIRETWTNSFSESVKLTGNEQIYQINLKLPK